MEVGYVHCPSCDRRYSAYVKDSGKIVEETCVDCIAMPGWRNDFGSPPTAAQWREFKKSGDKIRGNPPRE